MQATYDRGARTLRNRVVPVSPGRLPARPGDVIDRESPLAFTWNGRAVSGFAGDTIVSALAAGGCTVFSRSMKYHRPRGILTADYWDPNTLLQVGEEPNVRGGHRLLEAGMQVSAQNAWPSLRWDAKALTNLGGRALSAGFYYKTFMRPRWLWPAYEKVLARFAPGGVIDPDDAPRRHEKRYAHPDVVVAGGGPAGLAAAAAAARAGARVLLVEHEHTAGGHLRWGAEGERTLAGELIAEARAAGVQILTDATVCGRWEDNWLSITERGGGAGPEHRAPASRRHAVPGSRPVVKRCVQSNETVTKPARESRAIGFSYRGYLYNPARQVPICDSWTPGRRALQP